MSVSNILYVNPIPYLGGGAELSLLGVVRHLDRERFRPFVILPNGPVTDLTPELAALDAEVHLLEFGQFRGLDPSGWLRTGWAMSQFIRERGIDLIHGNASGALSYCAVASLLTHTRAICHFREAVNPDLLRSRVECWSLRKMRRLILVSRACGEALATTKLAEQVEVIYNGIDVDHFRPDPQAGPRLKAELQLPRDAILVGIVGQVAPTKGHEELLAALPEVLAHCPALHLLVVGDDRIAQRRWGRDYMGELRQMVPGSARANVHFLGHHHDVAPIVQGMDVLVVPSWWEPFGRVVIEGMACGVCVIATQCGGPPEIIKDRQTGFLVPPRDPVALARTLHHVTGSPSLRRRIGAAGRASAVEHFTVGQNCFNIMNLYTTILEEANHLQSGR